MAKFSKQLNKEPKEDFIILCSQHKIIPKLVVDDHQQLIDLSEFDSNGQLRPKSAGEDSEMGEGEQTSKMVKVDIIFNNGQKMTSGWGNTRKAAERNASIHGLQWLEQNNIAKSN